MDNTSKTSIAAIIFTIMFFLLVIFISLFRGITLYDLKINNLKIDNIFIKIDNKLILKANNIKILPTRNYNKEVIKIHKTFYLISKILPIFEKLEINNVYKNKILLIKKLSLNKNHFEIIMPNLKSSGKYLIKNNKTFIYAKTINILNYKIKDFHFISNLDNEVIKSIIKGKFNNQKFRIDTILSNNKLNFEGELNKLIFLFNQNNINTKHIFLNGKINLNNQKFIISFYTPFAKIDNKKYLVKSLENHIKLTNNYISLKSQKGFIKYDKYKLNLTNSLINYYIPQKLLLTHFDKSKLDYQNYIINTKNSELDYNLLNQNIFFHTNDIKLNNDVNATIKEALIIKNKKLFYKLIDDKISHKYANLKTDLIKGDLTKLVINDIIGKVLQFNTFIKSPKIDLANKMAKSKKIIFNNIIFTNNNLKFNKKHFEFSSHTNTLFNQNIKDILNYFKIDVPLTQISGYNDINFNIKSDFNKTFVNYLVLSKDSNFSFGLNKNFAYQNMMITGDLNKTNIILNNFTFNNDFIKSLLDTSININLDKKYINSYIFIKHLKIDKYFDIKNFYDKGAIDLSKNYAYLLNSNIFIDLKRKIIYLYSLKPLLKFSILKEIFNNGYVIIKLLKNSTQISAKTLLNYPLILNQKNPKELNIAINVKDNHITIKNKFIRADILNYEKIISYLKNIDIDIQGLINIINTTNKLANSNKKSDNSMQVVILGENTNFIYKGHKFLTQQATLTFNKELQFSAKYKQSFLKGYTKNNYLLLEGTHYNKEVLIPLFDFFNHFNYLDLDFVTVKSPDDFYTGKIYINKGSVKDLATLNNIIAFVNTIPALLSLKTPGFSAKGYKIKNGFINYLFYNDILYFKQIKIKGINLDFSGKGYVDLNKNKIKLKIHTIVKLKLKNIPILGKALSYLFFGKDGYLHINIFVNGDLNNPKVSKDLGGGIIETPITLFKRILTLPFNLF